MSICFGARLCKANYYFQCFTKSLFSSNQCWDVNVVLAVWALLKLYKWYKWYKNHFWYIFILLVVVVWTILNNQIWTGFISFQILIRVLQRKGNWSCIFKWYSSPSDRYVYFNTVFCILSALNQYRKFPRLHV